ncbi:50S ribosomal protein L29 [Candidatus Saccharibacteria bacterium]|nr:50S ribosomal protein L29 [Candidatus Saccharibacteria bacterium]
MAETKTTKKTAAPKKAAEVKTLDQLREELATKKADQIAAKRSHAAGELVNPRVLTVTRKEIARLHGAIRAHELASQKESK